MKNYVHNLGYVFKGACDCNNVEGIKGDFKVTYKGDALTANILWFVDPKGKLDSPAYNDTTTGRGFCPISSGRIESEESFEEDMLRFVKSNKPYYAVNNKSILTCVLKLNFDKDGNITDDSTFDFYVHVLSKRDKNKDGSYNFTSVCRRMVVGTANESFHEDAMNKDLYNSYVERIKQQLTKDICKDRLSFLSYLVQDRKDL